jgi:hypothetical protein
MTGGVVQGVSPEFKPQYLKKKEKEEERAKAAKARKSLRNCKEEWVMVGRETQ